ncbi:MAG: hypothetical protein ABL998_19955, partial [Planctomycetota bacterium]
MRRVLLPALLALAGCSDPEPRWIPLARGYRPSALLPLVQRWQEEGGMDPARVRPVLAGVQVSTPLARAGWRQGTDQVWRHPLPGGAYAHGAPGFLTLARGKSPLPSAPPEGELPPGQFRLVDGELQLALPPGQEPPEELLLEQRLEQGRPTEEGVWQLRFGQEFGDGIPVWQGEQAALTFDLPPGSTLRGSLRFLSRAADAPLTFRARLDGELVLECTSRSGELA